MVAVAVDADSGLPFRGCAGAGTLADPVVWAGGVFVGVAAGLVGFGADVATPRVCTALADRGALVDDAFGSSTYCCDPLGRRNALTTPVVCSHAGVNTFLPGARACGGLGFAFIPCRVCAHSDSRHLLSGCRGDTDAFPVVDNIG